MNGSGKTTIIKLLLKLYVPDKGEILIDGANICDIDTESYQTMIGAVFQDFVKYPLTVRENIGCGNVEEMKKYLEERGLAVEEAPEYVDR